VTEERRIDSRLISRRAFMQGAAATAAVPLVLRAQNGSDARLFQHGVASGDPLPDRVMLWTRVTPPVTRSAIGPIQVRWRLASDERLASVVASGTTDAAPARDFTVKIDAGGLRPGQTYFYAFDAGGEQSMVGRTRTLPSDAGRVRLASVSCANYASGYFNVYRCLANRDDIDAVVHLGDYIYEFANGVYGDAAEIGRVPLTDGEAATLNQYRARYAAYRSDPDLQAAHAKHPFIPVWDDHESANNAWAGGSESHTTASGPWAVRQMEAYRAYLEWLPIRESPDAGIRLYRGFRIGTLADLVMLDTRALRDRQATSVDATTLADPSRRSSDARRSRGCSISCATRNVAGRPGASWGSRSCSHRSRRQACPCCRSTPGTATRPHAAASWTSSPPRRSTTSSS
jgi:alkaline phosphatase D